MDRNGKKQIRQEGSVPPQSLSGPPGMAVMRVVF